MYKSIIFLLGLLVGLLPFGSSNKSNANAIAPEEYYTEQYNEICKWWLLRSRKRSNMFIW